MTLKTEIVQADDVGTDDVEGHVHYLNGRPLDGREGPDVFLVNSLRFSDLNRCLYQPHRDPGAVIDGDKPRKRRFRRSH